MSGPLSGVRVVDFTRQEMGPVSTQVLGDFGADVIRIDALESVDVNRRLGMFFGTESTFYLADNRNKRDIAIDLKRPAAIEVVMKLLATADVVVNNFRPGVMERLGLGYEVLREKFPRLIFAAGSGYGLEGPYVNKKGQDLIAQAMGGIMSMTGPKTGPPTPIGTYAADYLTGMLLAQGILLAIIEQRRSGLGQRVSVSLLDGQVAMQLQEITTYANGGGQQARNGLRSGHPGSGAPYGVYQTSDGYVAVGGGLAETCEVLGYPELLKDPRYSTREGMLEHCDEIRERLEEYFCCKPSAEWVRLFDEADILCGPVNDYEHVVADPQIQANEMIITINHPTAGPIRVVWNPVKLSLTPAEVRYAPPLIGQHTREILAELGYSPDEVSALIEANAVGANDLLASKEK